MDTKEVLRSVRVVYFFDYISGKNLSRLSEYGTNWFRSKNNF